MIPSQILPHLYVIAALFLGFASSVPLPDGDIPAGLLKSLSPKNSGNTIKSKSPSVLGWLFNLKKPSNVASPNLNLKIPVPTAPDLPSKALYTLPPETKFDAQQRWRFRALLQQRGRTRFSKALDPIPITGKVPDATYQEFSALPKGGQDHVMYYILKSPLTPAQSLWIKSQPKLMSEFATSDRIAQAFYEGEMDLDAMKALRANLIKYFWQDNARLTPQQLGLFREYDMALDRIPDAKRKAMGFRPATTTLQPSEIAAFGKLSEDDQKAIFDRLQDPAADTELGYKSYPPPAAPRLPSKAAGLGESSSDSSKSRSTTF